MTDTPDFVALEEIHAAALRALPRDVAGYLDRGAGYSALCVTVDCPVMGFRVRSKMNRFHPDRAVWSGNVAGDGTPNIVETYGNRIVPSWTWETLAAATARQDLPWIAKGILTSEPAEP